MSNQRRTDTRFKQVTRRRTFLSAAAAAGIAAVAGCTGNGENRNGGSSGPASVADASPMNQPVGGTAVSWDDLGDLEGEVTIYSGRTRDQIDPAFAALEAEYDGLTINRDYDSNDAQVNKLIEEGEATPADIMYSQDPGALGALEDNGLVQELPPDVVDAVPESFRSHDALWTGVSGRVRSVLYNSDRLDETGLDSWDELPTDILEYATDERLQGVISTRPNSGTFRGFIQAMVERKGEETTRQWIRDMVETQDAQLFSGGSAQAEAVNRGGDDDPVVGLGNSYYAARIFNEDSDAPIRATFTENDAGCLFSVAGIATTNTVDDPELVAEFVRHLLAAEGQEFMMDANGEYPVVEGVDYVGPLPNLEDINPPEFDLSSFDMELQTARDLINEEGMSV